MDENLSKAARALIESEVFAQALGDVLKGINGELLAATTPDEREDRWHEYHGLQRVHRKLSSWANDAEKSQEQKK